MEGFFSLRFREESINEGVEWKVCVAGGGCVHVCVCVQGGLRKWVTVCVERVECVRVSCVFGGCVVAYVHALHIPLRRALMRVCSPLPRSYENVFIKCGSSPNTLIFPPTCRYLFFAPFPFSPPPQSFLFNPACFQRGEAALCSNNRSL